MSGSGISWAICKSAPRSRQITTPAPHHSVFLQTGCPSCRPTNSVKALKASNVMLCDCIYRALDRAWRSHYFHQFLRHSVRFVASGLLEQEQQQIPTVTATSPASACLPRQRQWSACCSMHCSLAGSSVEHKLVAPYSIKSYSLSHSCMQSRNVDYYFAGAAVAVDSSHMWTFWDIVYIWTTYSCS